jgi:hypothetical protein
MLNSVKISSFTLESLPYLRVILACLASEQQIFFCLVICASQFEEAPAEHLNTCNRIAYRDT